MKMLRGYLCLIGWIILTGIELALAAPVTTQLEWNPPPAGDQVTITHLRVLKPDGSSEYLADSTTNTVTVEMAPGTYRVVVAHMNAHGWSEFSDPVEVVVADAPVAPKPAGLRVIEVQTSSNLKDWTTDGYYVVRPQPDGTYPDKQFFRTVATTGLPFSD